MILNKNILRIPRLKRKAEGQPPSSRRGGGHGRNQASLSSLVPPDAFQIILERIDGLGMSKLSTPTNLQPCRTKSTCSQLSLIASRTSISPLAIPVKKGE